MPTPIDPQVMKALSENLSKITFRKAFHLDPNRALSRAGIDPKALPEHMVEELAALSLEELNTLAKIKDRIGRIADDTNGYVVF